jgi:hypothetical protein
MLMKHRRRGQVKNASATDGWLHFSATAISDASAGSDAHLSVALSEPKRQVLDAHFGGEGEDAGCGEGDEGMGGGTHSG